jgi:hypothetical protein
MRLGLLDVCGTAWTRATAVLQGVAEPGKINAFGTVIGLKLFEGNAGLMKA